MPKRGRQPIQRESLLGTLDLLILKTLVLVPAHAHPIARALQFGPHPQIEIAANVASGMPPDAARAAAIRRLGNRTLTREDIYQMNTIAILEHAWRDVRFGARLLRRNPGFAVVAVLSLA